MRALDHDDLVHGLACSRVEHLGEQQALLRGAEAGCLAGREDDRGEVTTHAAVTESITTGWGGCSVAGSPSCADPLDDVDALRHRADDRVVGRQADVVAGDDEELAARRFPRGSVGGLRHRDDTLRVGGVGRRRVDRLVARTARPHCVGSPPWITKPGTMRWKIVSSKYPASASATSDAAVAGVASRSSVTTKVPQ